ncbi:MAG: ROK family protein [Nanoarchaeota archaeon]|nr:ROK family protein [DPANN group archaeon]MBL7116528.1 ROK family protein [Nanoarchaeota archaeon]
MRLGVDVGGTKIEAALVSEDGKIINRIRTPTQDSKGRKVVINNILSVIKKLDKKNLSVVGLSIAGVIDEKGVLSCPSNLKCLEGVNVAKELERSFGKKVLQENDANCFVLAEYKIGAARGYKNVVGIILGTGIGGGIIINRKLYKGKTGGAGEFGHTVISANKDFETLCSGPGIVRRYRDAGGKIKDPNPEKIFASKELIARQVVEDTYNYFRIGFVNIINSLDPDIIVLGGGLSNLPLYSRLNREVKRYVIPALAKNVKIVKNKLGDSSGVIGAAFLH